MAGVAPVRVAIIGTGAIAGRHAEAMAEAAEAGGAELTAAMDVDDSRLAPFCAQFGVGDGYRDLGSLLARARPGLVCICTPPAASTPWP